VLTVSEDREAVFAALKAGAAGYIVKGATPRELVESARRLARGRGTDEPEDRAAGREDLPRYAARRRNFF
jgi:two-component system NarL family response regulator